MADHQIGNQAGLIVASGDNRSGALDNDNMDSIAAMKSRLATVGGVNEVQSVENDATGGTFTLTFDGETTGNIAYNADAATVKTALEALSNIDEVTVTGAGTSADPWLVEFSGDTVSDTNQPLMTADDTNLTGETEGTTVAEETAGFTYYDEDRLNQMTYNDLVYAVRLEDNSATLTP